MDPEFKAYIIGVGLSPDGLSVDDTLKLREDYEMSLFNGNQWPLI